MNINQAYDKKPFHRDLHVHIQRIGLLMIYHQTPTDKKHYSVLKKYNIGIEERAHSATKHCVVCTFLGIWLTNETAKIKPMLVLLLLCILDF